MIISKKIFSALQQYPIIPVFWQYEALNTSKKVCAAVISLQFGSIIDLGEICAKLHNEYKASVFVHIELIKGLNSDISAVEYVKQCGADGIISTKPSVIEAAHGVGVVSVLRTFIEDSRSLKRAIDIAKKTIPEALDILPGPVIPEIIGELKSRLTQPIIASGLIKREEQVKQLLNIGCLAISTSHSELWRLNTSM